jgi:hypothetical protein
VAVELLERDHRQVDVVLFEAEQRGRVVHQHVGVEHEQLGRPGAARLAGARLGLGRALGLELGEGLVDDDDRRGRGLGVRVVQMQLGWRLRLGREAGFWVRLPGRGAACDS